MKKVISLCTILVSVIMFSLVENNALAESVGDTHPNPIDKPGWALTAHDEFEGPNLDDSLWFDRYLGFRTSLDRGNADYYFNEDEGSIVLRVTEDMPRYYASGNERMRVSSIQTAQGDFHQGSTTKHHDEPHQSNFSQLYGYFEIRAKSQSDRSGHSAFWFNTDDPSEYTPGARNTRQHTEIDVFENFKGNQYLFNLYNPANHGLGYTRRGQYDFNFADDFHTYAMEWTPEEVKFYVDNKLMHTHDGTKLVQKPMFAYLSLYVDTWGGDSAATLPAEFEIDYFRAYRMEGSLTLEVGDGEYKYLTPDQLTYEYVLPEGVEEIPQVRVHDRLNNSSLKVTQANESTRTAVIELTEEDGSEYTYQVKFTSDLSGEINYAQSLLGVASIGEELGDYPEEAYNTLEDAITDAETVLNDGEATVAEKFAALQQLKQAIEMFKSARVMIDGTHRYVVYENFNLQPTGMEPIDWQIHPGGISTVQEDPSETDKSIRINATTGGKTGVAKTLDSLSGEIIIETQVRSDTNNWVVLPYLYEGNNIIYSLAFDNGQIKVHTGGSWQNIQPYEQGAWYDIKMVINTDTDTFDLYIDGEERMTNKPLRNQAEAITSIDYHTTYRGDSMYVNYLKVYTQEPVNTEGLKSVLETAQAITNEDEYTEESYATLQAVITAAEALLADEEATQEEVDAELEALQAAIKNLVVYVPEEPVVDTEELESVLETAQAITNEDEYTEESYTELQAVITAAEALLEDGEATQEEVDAAVVALQEAIENLVALEPAPGDGDDGEQERPGVGNGSEFPGSERGEENSKAHKWNDDKFPGSPTGEKNNHSPVWN